MRRATIIPFSILILMGCADTSVKHTENSDYTENSVFYSPDTSSPNIHSESEYETKTPEFLGDENHAFEKVYFGTKIQYWYDLTINNLKYKRIYLSDEKQLIIGLKLQGVKEYKDKKEMIQELNEIAKIISKKYSSPKSIKETIKYDPTKEYDEAIARMNKKFTGQPIIENSKLWTTPFKSIKLGYQIVRPHFSGNSFNISESEFTVYRILIDINRLQSHPEKKSINYSDTSLF